MSREPDFITPGTVAELYARIHTRRINICHGLILGIDIEENTLLFAIGANLGFDKTSRTLEYNIKCVDCK